jgi:L-alanine-DL-glutamate epimerase-like enolase superfamily enzyme
MAAPGAETITRLETSAYCIPTDRPEADGTFAWTSTTLVLVEAIADSGALGLGFSYCSAAAAEVILGALTSAVAGASVGDLRGIWLRMLAAVRNIGRPGVAANAISAVDVALWDLKARLVGVSVARLLGASRSAVPIYGSGGFTSYSDAELADQLGGWVRQGIPRVKMKIGTTWGTRPETDVHRVSVARQAIGPEADLFVDANGAYSARQSSSFSTELRNLSTAHSNPTLDARGLVWSSSETTRSGGGSHDEDRKTRIANRGSQNEDRKNGESAWR